jgi:hypothetical protein
MGFGDREARKKPELLPSLKIHTFVDISTYCWVSGESEDNHYLALTDKGR